MALKRLKPVTPAQRFTVLNTYSELTTDKPEKSLTISLGKTGGRNNDGRMTMRYRGRGHKKLYRIIDFKRDKINILATVKSVEYDPYRSLYISVALC